MPTCTWAIICGNLRLSVNSLPRMFSWADVRLRLPSKWAFKAPVRANIYPRLQLTRQKVKTSPFYWYRNRKGEYCHESDAQALSTE